MKPLPRDHLHPDYRGLVLTSEKCEWNGRLASYNRGAAIVVPPEVVKA